MPELRSAIRNLLAPVPPIEIDSKTRDQNAYRAGLVRRGAQNQGAFRAGKIVEIRNGLPDSVPYVYRGTGNDQLEESDYA